MHAFSEEWVTDFFYFSTKTYVVGTQKNRLDETVLLSTQNICKKLWVRKYLHFYAEKNCLSKPIFMWNIMVHNIFTWLYQCFEKQSCGGPL